VLASPSEPRLQGTRRRLTGGVPTLLALTVPVRFTFCYSAAASLAVGRMTTAETFGTVGMSDLPAVFPQQSVPRVL